MLKMKQCLRELKTQYLQSFKHNCLKTGSKHPVISITFDDVPRSAFENAVPILNAADIKATFYVAMGLTDKNVNNETVTYLHPKDIIELHRNGHDIACHTYSHYMLDTGSTQELVKDANKNVEALCQLLGSDRIEHFSYPFGQVNFSLKKILSNNYKTMRSSRPGINLNKTDLNLLRATSIYNPSFNKKTITEIIERTVAQHGWLILYTHSVEKNPDEYSCTPEQFEWVVKECLRSSAKILPITEAYNYLTSES